ncbi:helix-turn-helix domain-containing protein [Myroides odoratimimus]|uniref:helix-turn-helix domain-containing protein n=1 Tax=Myroides odoratimimus TaxID=76832 RepID=UPI00257596BA|nr:helix-turn-helix transcriptional regulator [Myroides odoratimimus]
MTVNQKIEFLINSKCQGNKSEFARKVGVSPTVIENVVGSRKGKPSFEVLSKILSSELEVDANWLFDIEDKIVNTKNENSIYVDEYYNNEDNVEIFTNSNGNKFYLYPNGRIEIEVDKIPFKAYASYIECYQDEVKVMNNVFESIRFKADHIARGNYKCFISEGDSMNGGMLDDTPGGSEILAREVGRQLWDNLHNTKYGLIFVTKTGIMHKDFGGYNEATGMFTLTSRNKSHKPFEYPANDVYQIFNVIKRSF